MPFIVALALQAATAAPLICPLDKPYDAGNVFARILRREMPASLIAESADMIAFTPIDWQHPGHALVVPKRAVRSLDDMTPAEMANALAMARRIGAAQRTAFGATGYTIAQNNGRNQHVCHVHFHVVPNTPVEPVDTASRAQMDAIASKLKAALPAK